MTTEGSRQIFFSDEPLEKHTEAEKLKDMAEEAVELANLKFLVEDEVGLTMQLIPNDDDNSTSPENFPSRNIL